MPSPFTDYDGVGVRCSVCGSQRSMVMETRSNNGAVYRRRKCQACGARFKTREQAYAADTKYIECSDEPSGGGVTELPGLFPYTSLGRKGGG